MVAIRMGSPQLCQHPSPSFPSCYLLEILTLCVRPSLPSRHTSASTVTAFSLIYSHITAEKSDSAVFMSHKVNVIMSDKPQRVQMTYLHPGKRTVMSFKVKVCVQMNVVNLSSP